MEDQEKEYEQDEWKSTLRSKFVTAMTGDSIEKHRVHEDVGYYYEYYASASLYKYYSDTPEKLSAVKNNQMWYSAPCNFNDVFDCDISIDDQKVFHEVLKLFPDKRGIRAGSNAWKNLRATTNQQLRLLRAKLDELKTTTGVSCLSESEDSLLMWAHYANNHRGMCVEYDLLEISRVLKFTAVPVIYSQDRACFNFVNLENTSNDAVKLLIHSLTSKSPEWSYEKEWRIIRDQKACGDKWDVNKRGALLEMIRPRSIILGCATTVEFEKEVREYCQSTQINLYKMEKDPMQYRLNKKAILQFNIEY